jgi:Transcription initiation factor TFIID 23-30kDa subunit
MAQSNSALNTSSIAVIGGSGAALSLSSSSSSLAVGWSEPLSEFLLAVDSYESTIPLQVTKYYMKRAGVLPDGDPRIAKIISLAADKFLAETLNEAKSTLEARLLHSKKRSAGEGIDQQAAVKLEMEDLERSYEMQGIFQRRKLN